MRWNFHLSEDSFDLVVMQFGIMFFPDREKGLQEALSCIKTWRQTNIYYMEQVETNAAIHEGRLIIESYFGDDPPIFYNVPFSMYNEKELICNYKRSRI